ncbi:sodium channel protein Nach-like isoform X2 [Pseudomyrmex gracilis]|nr:sodium channel protein Nach-like isoform X2 [Pseudomyrmex gracilis]
MIMSWNYYAAHPTLTVIESTHHGIWNYPFPAITVCNINRVSYNLTTQFVENLKIPDNVSKEYLIQEMRLLTELIVPGIFGHDVRTNLSNLQNIFDSNNLSILDVISLITQNCSTLLQSCKWKGKLDQCDKYFKQVLSRDGLCCSFNYYSLPGTTIANDRISTSACGFESGMTVIVNPEPNDYHAAIVGGYGVKVLIHYSFDYPNFNAALQLVRLNSQHFVSVNPIQMYSNSNVRNLALSTRRCIFSDEADAVLYANVKQKNLTYAEYSYHNCLAECRATIAKAKCGCIPYYFPQNGTKVCDLKDVYCLKSFKSLFDTSWPLLEKNDNLPRNIEKIDGGPCGCIPDCSLFQYPIESSFGSLDSSIYYNDGSFTQNPRNAISIKNHSIIHVYFNDLVAFQYRRILNYSWRNLFASFGGLLGLFVGFSLMTVFEFLYFFVIRVIVDARVKRSNIQ